MHHDRLRHRTRRQRQVGTHARHVNRQRLGHLIFDRRCLHPPEARGLSRVAHGACATHCEVHVHRRLLQRLRQRQQIKLKNATHLPGHKHHRRAIGHHHIQSRHAQQTSRQQALINVKTTHPPCIGIGNQAMPRQKRIHTGAFLLEVLGAQQHALMPLDTFGGGGVEVKKRKRLKKKKDVKTPKNSTSS